MLILVNKFDNIKYFSYLCNIKINNNNKKQNKQQYDFKRKYTQNYQK